MHLLLPNLKLVIVCIAISTALGNTVSEALGIMWTLGYFAGFLLEHVYHIDRNEVSQPVSFAIMPYTCSLIVVGYLDRLFRIES